MDDVEQDIADLKAQIAADLAADTRGRATDAARHLRLAMELVMDLQETPAMYRVARLMDEAATLLIGVLK